MKTNNPGSIASLIAQRISSDTNAKHRCRNSGSIKHVILDNVLPESLALEIYKNFPRNEDMNLRDGLQERKFISVEFPSYSSLIKDCLYAFQEPIVIDLIASLFEINDLSGDPELYAGGISSMTGGCYLNPHIDNSHDRLRQRFRRLNTLYYVSHDWQSETEGSLQLWPEGLKGNSITIPSKFNRLVIMATDKKSIHSVSKISNQTKSRRLCVSNYYFSPTSAEGYKYYHSTSFRGFPGELVKDLVLRSSAQIRTTLKSMTGTFFGSVISTGHFRKHDNHND
ncbi:2OG-Fe(II) oxygenase [Cylindrospermopsis raciborskii]|uniref:2OG-Fe(II) oxygenase n=1 Tax=Cylindrospermopsis raciborskii TaxID=77022 RepID=UPI001144FC66|nr:2OG-Fe(II) oxygenase [Cylindrospermopsis raciborskii]TPX27630.1 2OG-Fe(II) oxygenase [Cylindrospermopsis raciborskii GIHE 2018]